MPAGVAHAPPVNILRASCNSRGSRSHYAHFFLLTADSLKTSSNDLRRGSARTARPGRGPDRRRRLRRDVQRLRLSDGRRDASALVRRAFAWSVEDLRVVLGAAARVADLKTLAQLTTALEAATRRNRGPAEKPLVLRDDDDDEALAVLVAEAATRGIVLLQGS